MKSLFKNRIIPFLFGTIVTILVTKLFDPLIDTLLSSVYDSSGKIVKNFIDHLYIKISEGAFFSIFSLVTLVFSFVFTFIFTFFFFKLKFIYEQDIKRFRLLQKKKQLKHNHAEPQVSRKQNDITNKIIQNAIGKSKKSIITKTNRFKEQISKSKVISLYRYTKAMFIMTFLLFYLFFILQVFVIETSIETNTNFEIVAPYISDQEYKQLKSDFYTISSKEDFAKLTERLNLIAEDNALKLKK